MLLMDRQRGSTIDADDRNLRYAFAGAVLMDLAKKFRVDTDLERLTVVDPAPLDDDILDPLLLTISESNKRADTVYWIKRFSAPEIVNPIIRRAAERLVSRGIFNRDPGGTLFLDNLVNLTRRYPGMGLPEGQDVVLRVMNILFSEDIPSPDETMLIALMDACGIFEQFLTQSELEERRHRIAIIRDLDLFGQAVRKAILVVRKPEAEDSTLRKSFLIGRRARGKRPPMAPGVLPVVGHSLRLRPVPTKTLVGFYRSLGPVFRVRDLASDLTVLVGPEANLFCQRYGRLLFRSHDTYTPLFEGMEAQRIILSMDGEEHFKLRKALSSGFTRDRFLSKLPEIRDIILGELPEDGNAVAMDTFSQLTAKAIGIACTGYILTSREVEDMDFFLRRLIAATVLRIMPRFMINTRRTRRAKAGFFGVFANMCKARMNDGIGEGRPDVMTAMLELHRSNPQFLPENELRVSCLGPIFSGLHTTASTGTSAMYLLLKHPVILEQVRAEADELFSNNGPTEKKIKALDITSRTVLETLRMYNPFGSLFRHAVNTFDFGGYTIPAGTRLFLPTAVPHYCSEFFPEPDRFDIDRFLPQRAEHRKPGVYMPFGFGTHRCLGSAIAETHLMFALATILHYRHVEMDPSSYRLRFMLSGVPAPTRGFRLTFARRQPAPGKIPSQPA